MIVQILIIIFLVLSAIILHECAHGWMANKLGDPTAKEMGRLTLNPLSHIDPVGTILIPGILVAMRMMGMNIFVFGWAKPVPVNFMRLHNPKRDMIWVGLAGPVTNILIAVALSFLFKADIFPDYWHLIQLGIFINLLLAVFNMVPIPPLDGSRLVMGLLPRSLAIPYARLERYGILIVFGLLYFGLFEYAVLPVIEVLEGILGIR